MHNWLTTDGCGCARQSNMTVVEIGPLGRRGVTLHGTTGNAMISKIKDRLQNGDGGPDPVNEHPVPETACMALQSPFFAAR